MLTTLNYTDETRSLSATSVSDDKLEITTNQLGSYTNISAARKHNSAIPIHSLPPEIFFHCLFLSIDFASLNRLLVPQLRALAQVCASWLHFIRSESRFWCLLNLHEAEWLDVMLRKNPHGALAARVAGFRSESSRNGFFHVIQEQAHRLERLTWHTFINANGAELFDFHAPVLKYLDIRGNTGTAHFVIPLDAPALEYVHVVSLNLPWTSPSLADLQYLKIGHLCSYHPNVAELIAILHACPGLQWFEISDSYGSNYEDEMPWDSAQLIQLHALRGLILERNYCAPLVQYVISALDTPHCHSIRLEINFKDLLRPGSNAFKLCMIAMRDQGSKITVSYLSQPKTIIILGSRNANEQECISSWASDPNPSGGVVNVRNIPYDADSWRFLVKNLEPLMEQGDPLMLLKLYYGPDTFVGNDLSIWHFATSIEFHHTYPHVLPALNYLSTSTVNLDGSMQWPCPRLTSLTFVSLGRKDYRWEGRSISTAILDFAVRRARASGDEVGFGTGVSQPVALEVILGPPTIIDEIQGRVPDGIRVAIHKEPPRWRQWEPSPTYW